MRRMRRTALAVYLIAAALVVGACAGSLFGPYADRIGAMATSGSGKVTLAICLSVVVLNMLAVFVYLIFDRPEPTCVRLEGNPDIEVASDALTSIARTAAAERDIMVEDVRARVVGRDRSGVDIKIEAIALTCRDVEGLARRAQLRVQAACEEMLGVPGVRVRVRFLPSKTESVTKEAVDE